MDSQQEQQPAVQKGAGLNKPIRVNKKVILIVLAVAVALVLLGMIVVANAEKTEAVCNAIGGEYLEAVNGLGGIERVHCVSKTRKTRDAGKNCSWIQDTCEGACYGFESDVGGSFGMFEEFAPRGGYQCSGGKVLFSLPKINLR